MKKDIVKSFDCAVKSVEPGLKKILLSISESEKKDIFEIRLRCEKPVIFITKNGTRFLSANGELCNIISDSSLYCSVETIRETFNRMCCYSVHSYLSGIVKGYVTMEGGHRAGICGTAVCDNLGNITSIKDVSGINIRISREVYGSADRIIKELYDDTLKSIIIAGPPASGKTTVLRDAVRQLSSEEKNYKVALIDERQEIASVNSGIAQNDVGINCDILDGYPKNKAMMIALKTLSPDIIALDEVGDEDEIESIRLAINSGVRFIVTVHASDYNELVYRPQIKRLIETYSFSKVVMLNKEPIGEIVEIYDTKELRDEIIRRDNNLDIFDHNELKSVCTA